MNGWIADATVAEGQRGKKIRKKEEEEEGEERLDRCYMRE